MIRPHARFWQAVLRWFNVLGAYSCFTVPNIPTVFSATGYVHALFAVLFAVAAFIYRQDSQVIA